MCTESRSPIQLFLIYFTQMIFKLNIAICLLFLFVCVRRLDVFSVPLHTLHPTPSCVCIQGAHKTLYTHLASASPHRQTDRQQPFAGYYVCVYIFKLKKTKARRFSVCCAIDLTSGGGEKLVNSPMPGILYMKKKRIASILLLFGWGGRQFHEHKPSCREILSLFYCLWRVKRGSVCMCMYYIV